MAKYFDRLAPEWGSAPSKFEVREKLTSMMGLSPNSVIADIGCGRGVMFEHLLKTDPLKIIAVDISGEMLRYAKEQFSESRIEYVHDDFFDAPLPMLDAAVFFNSYPHFFDKSALTEKLARVLKKNGVSIIAHSLSRAEINGNHRGESVSKLSVPLDDAETEASKFQKYFSADVLIDDDEMYFVKMTRK